MTKAEIDQTFQTALDLYNKENYSEAIKLFGTLVNHKHAEAIYYLSKCYFEGKGVEESRQIAHYYFDMAMNLGFEPACSIISKEFKGLSYKLEYERKYRYQVEIGQTFIDVKGNEFVVLFVCPYPCESYKKGEYSYKCVLTDKGTYFDERDYNDKEPKWIIPKDPNPYNKEPFTFEYCHSNYK